MEKKNKSLKQEVQASAGAVDPRTMQKEARRCHLSSGEWIVWDFQRSADLPGITLHLQRPNATFGYTERVYVTNECQLRVGQPAEDVMQFDRVQVKALEIIAVHHDEIYQYAVLKVEASEVDGTLT